MDERIADQVAVHTHGGTGPLVGARRRVRTMLLLLCACPSIDVGAHVIARVATEVKRAATLTGGGDARSGRTDIRKYGCNTCHEISGVPEREVSSARASMALANAITLLANFRTLPTI